MVDNVTLDGPGSGGAVIATDEISGKHHQRMKVQHGADGTATDVSTASPLPVSINNNSTVSTNNSSAVVLAGDAVFTGTGEDVSNYAAISVQVYASHASATDGLSMEFSTDNTNWDEKHVATIAADTSREFPFPTHAKHFRVVYTNGSTLQTSFRLQTILHVQSISGTSHALDESTAPDDVGILTKSVTIAQAAGTGNFVPVQATTAGNLKVSIEEADTSASGMAKAEDAVHSSGDVGVMALAVRADALTPTAANGDYTPLQTNEEGALWIHVAPNIIDSGNSSTSTLTSGSTFTGTGIDLLEHAAVTIQIDASHDSATNGIKFQFSIDNSNWDSETLFTYTAANGARNFQFSALAQYFRIVYVNGGTNQTHFRLQTILHHDSPITTIHRIADNVSEDRSATVHKSVIVAQTSGAGDFVPVAANSQGKLQVGADADISSLPDATVDTNHFQATVTSADATTATSIKAKTADKKIHVTSLVISVGSTALEAQLQSDNGTPVVQMEEMFFPANGGLTQTACDPKLPLFILPTNEDLDVITSAAGDITVSVSGYVV